MAPGTVTKKGALVLFLRAILDLGEQAEQGNHNLGLQVLLSLEVFWVEFFVAGTMIRKGQACGSVGLLHHFILGLFAATN
jgi:hypothetical protein